MTAIIYAAGAGSRLGAGTHKGLVRVADMPLIEYALTRVSLGSPKQIVVVTGHYAADLKRHIGESWQGIPIVYVHNPHYALKGNMSSLWAAREHCDDDVAFTTTDLVCALDDVRAFFSSPAQNKILIDTHPSMSEEDDAVHVSTEQGNIVAVRKRLEPSVRHGAAIGLYGFSRDTMRLLLRAIASRMANGGIDVSLYYAIDDMMRLVDTAPIPTSGAWFDVDTPEECGRAHQYVTDAQVSYQLC